VLPAVAAAVVALTVAWWAVTAGSLIDTTVFRGVAHAVLRGQSPYFLPTVVPFVYPPAGVLLALPAALGSSVSAAATVWVAVSLVALARTTAILVGLAWPSLTPGRARRRACWLFAAACLLEPTLITLSFGQVGLVLLWLTVEGLRSQPRSSTRTWLVGVAAAAKLTPGVVLLGLAAAGRWRSALWGVVGFLAASAAAAAVSPAAVRAYAGGAWRLAQDVNSTRDVLNHSLIGVAALVGLPPWAGPAVAATVLVLGIALTARLWRQGDELAGLSAVLATGLLVSPVSWGHHWVAIYPSLVLLLREVGQLRGVGRSRFGAGILLSTAIAGMLFWVDQAGLQGSRVLQPGETWTVLQREWYVLWGVALLIWTATSLLIRQSSPVAEPVSARDDARAGRA
jgi:alpha-1,2-mannosyltransferase